LSDCSVGTDDFYGDYLASVTPCQQCRQETQKYSATHQCAVCKNLSQGLTGWIRHTCSITRIAQWSPYCEVYGGVTLCACMHLLLRLISQCLAFY